MIVFCIIITNLCTAIAINLWLEVTIQQEIIQQYFQVAHLNQHASATDAAAAALE